MSWCSCLIRKCVPRAVRNGECQYLMTLLSKLLFSLNQGRLSFKGRGLGFSLEILPQIPGYFDRKTAIDYCLHILAYLKNQGQP